MSKIAIVLTLPNMYRMEIHPLLISAKTNIAPYSYDFSIPWDRAIKLTNQYIDEILLASVDPHFLTFACHFLVHLITSSDLIISPKSVFVPTHTITWLGKILDHGTLTNTPSRVAYVLAQLWLLRCSKLTFRSLQRSLGFLQWLCSPCSLHAPFLASSYQLLLRATLPPLLPRSL